MVERMRHLPSGQRVLFFVGVALLCLIGAFLASAFVSSDPVRAVIDLALVVLLGWAVVIFFQCLLINQAEKDAQRPRRRRRR